MEIISVSTFWTIWLLVHLMLSVALIGALTHQAVSVAMPVRKIAGPAGFVTRFRAVPAPGYAFAVCVLWVLTFLVGSFIYVKYRIYIRIPIEQAGHWKTQGFFDFKEHIASIGLMRFSCRIRSTLIPITLPSRASVRMPDSMRSLRKAPSPASRGAPSASSIISARI